MYESPITVDFSDVVIEKAKTDMDNLIFKACQKVVVAVDKDELIKALEYDRGQYEKGYADGRAYKPPIMTNADKIRQMMDEELAMLLQPICPTDAECPTVDGIKDCYKCWLDWLKQEVSDD